MKGISIIHDDNGKPAVITIDLRYLDPVLRPLVDELLELLKKETDNANSDDDYLTTS